MDLTVEKLDEIVEDIWVNHIKRDFKEKRIQYFEATLVAAFYHYLRFEIDKYPKYRVFLEHKLSRNSDEDSGSTKEKYDLVIMKAEKEKDWESIIPLEVIETIPYWTAFEFKFVINLYDKYAQKDFNKLKEAIDIKRAYFICIYQKDKSNVIVNKKDKWLNKYRECNAFLKDEEWIFEFRLGEKILNNE